MISREFVHDGVSVDVTVFDKNSIGIFTYSPVRLHTSVYQQCFYRAFDWRWLFGSRRNRLRKALAYHVKKVKRLSPKESDKAMLEELIAIAERGSR